MIVLVTGASAGFGEEMARIFARNGHRVIAAARRSDRLARLHAELGRLDGVLHCAAEFKGLTPLEHTDPAAFARAMRACRDRAAELGR